MFETYILSSMSNQRDRLSRARIHAGFKTAKDAARHFIKIDTDAGIETPWKESTYSANESGTAPFSMKRARLYGDAFGVSAEWLYDGSGQMIPGGPSQNSDHGLSLYGSTPSGKSRIDSAKSPLQSIQSTHTVTIKGKVKAGTWLAMKEYDQDLGTVLFNAPKLRGKNLYGLIVEGQSVNLKYPEGTTVIIVDIYDRRPKNRDFVVLRNYIAVDIAEMTLKQAVKGDDGIVRYFCYSDDPEYRDAEPIVIPPRDEFAQLGYEVIGSVVGSMPRYEESDEEELFGDTIDAQLGTGRERGNDSIR